MKTGGLQGKKKGEVKNLCLTKRRVKLVGFRIQKSAQRGRVPVITDARKKKETCEETNQLKERGPLLPEEIRTSHIHLEDGGDMTIDRGGNSKSGGL